MTNPINEIISKQKSFTYFHTRVLNREILDRAKQAKKSLEIDLSIDKNGKPYIGHPLSFYEFMNIQAPNNLELDIVLNEMKSANIFLVLDIKSKKLISLATEIIKNFGAEKCLLHSYTSELEFKPYSSDLVIEPHWINEHIALESIMEIKYSTGVPLALSCRGIDKQYFDTHNEDDAIDKIVEVVNGNIEPIALNLHTDDILPVNILNSLLENSIIPLINIDKTLNAKFPPLYLGASDHLSKASNT